MAARNISSNGSERKRKVRLQRGPSIGKNGVIVAGLLSGVCRMVSTAQFVCVGFMFLLRIVFSRIRSLPNDDLFDCFHIHLMLSVCVLAEFRRQSRFKGANSIRV